MQKIRHIRIGDELWKHRRKGLSKAYIFSAVCKAIIRAVKSYHVSRPKLSSGQSRAIIWAAQMIALHSPFGIMG